MERKEHELNNNQIASKGKIFLGAVLDFCLHMLLLMMIYGFVANPILNYMGTYSGYQEAKIDFFNYIKQTGLYTFRTDGEPINSNVEAANYVKKLVKTSYYYEGKEFKELKNGQEEVVTLTEKDTIGYQEDGKFKNDNLAYYFFNYRTSDDCDLPNSIKNDFGNYETQTNYFYSFLLNFEDTSNKLYLNPEIFVDGKINSYVSDKPILDSRYAELLHSYLFLNKPSEEGQPVLEKFSRMYHNAVNLSFKELDENSIKYQTTYGEILNQENSIYQKQIVSIVLSYLVSFTIYFIIIPIFLKEGKTIGLRFNRLTYSTINDKYPEIKNIAIKDAILFLTQAISMIFPILFMGSSSLLFVQLGIGFRFIYAILFFALISLASIIMAAWGKKHQFLCEYTSLLVQKDTDSLKVSEENAVID